jgi:hypothetical protein
LSEVLCQVNEWIKHVFLCKMQEKSLL